MSGQRWKYASRGAGVELACVAVLIATAGLGFGQEGAAGGTAAGSAQAAESAQAVKRDYRFEVASIRPAETPNGRNSRMPGPPAPDRFTDEQTTIAVLAMRAFGAKSHFDVEYQPWMATTYFTVNATFPEGATRADLPIMIQHLLEDRFGLVFHRETRHMKGYDLIVAKSGPRLVKSGPPPDPSVRRGSNIEMKNGVPQFSKDAGSGTLYSRAGATWRGRNRTMQKLAGDLASSQELAAPVRDATGLAGEYDYTLTFSPEGSTGPASNIVGPMPVAGGSAQSVGAAAPPEQPMLRDALEEQLGLKLQQNKDVPVDVVVLDSANKTPTEN